MRARRGPVADADDVVTNRDLAARVGVDHTSEDLDGGRLTRPVSAEQRVDLTRPDLHEQGVQREGSRIRLAEAAHRQSGARPRENLWHQPRPQAFL
jgi:hypothetical protein